MAIKINTGFEVGYPGPIDVRQYLSKSEMVSVNDNIYPDKFLALCKDDGKIYLYNKENELLDSTGKFRVQESGLDTLVQMETMPEAADNIGKIYQYIGSTTESFKNGYWYKSSATTTIYTSYELTDSAATEAALWVLSPSEEITTDTVLYTDDTCKTPNEDLAITAITEGNITIHSTSTEADYTYTYSGATKENKETTGAVWSRINVQPELTIEIPETPEDGYLKSYVFKLDETVIGTVNIPKDLVVTSGKITKITIKEKADPEEADTFIVDGDTEKTYVAADVEDEASDYYGYPVVAGTFINLAIANQKNPVFVNTKDLIDSDLGIVSKDITSNVTVGGVKAGDTILQGTGLTALVEKLLVKYFPPVVETTSTITNTVVEKGTTISPTITATAVKNSLDVTKISINMDETEVASNEVDVAEGGTVTYDATDIATDTVFTGVATDGTESSESSISYVFVDPYFKGVVTDASSIDISELTKVIEKNGKKTFTFTADNKYIVFAYPAAYADLTSILDANGFENIDSFTKTVADLTVTSGTVSYKIYTSNTPVTCTGFKYIFN